MVDMKNIIYNETCIDTMKRMPDNFIDLVVTSPPYDNLRTYKGYSFDFENIAIELFRILKQNRIIVWIVNDATINGCKTLTSFKQCLYFKSIGFIVHDIMIYLKSGVLNSQKNRYQSVFEYMFILSKDKPEVTNILKRKTKHKGNSKSTTREINGKLKSITQHRNEYCPLDNVWIFSTGYNKTTKDKFAYYHPAMFPEELCRRHILSWSNENDIVYDPFMGSGTTAKMAILTNRNFIGSEISSEYIHIINRRIKETKDKLCQADHQNQ